MKHPKGLYLLFFTEMWERFSYYGMRAMLILYLTKSALEGGLGFDVRQASLIYGFFTGFVYFTPLIGGWLADNYLGQRKSITIGGLTMMLGQFCLATKADPLFLTIGLLLLIVGPYSTIGDWISRCDVWLSLGIFYCWSRNAVGTGIL